MQFRAVVFGVALLLQQIPAVPQLPPQSFDEWLSACAPKR